MPEELKLNGEQNTTSPNEPIILLEDIQKPVEEPEHVKKNINDYINICIDNLYMIFETVKGLTYSKESIEESLRSTLNNHLDDDKFTLNDIDSDSDYLQNIVKKIINKCYNGDDKLKNKLLNDGNFLDTENVIGIINTS